MPNDLTHVTIYSKGRNGIDEHGLGDDLIDRQPASRELYPELRDGGLFPLVAVLTMMALIVGGSAWLLKLTVAARMQTAVAAVGALVFIASACLAGDIPPGIVSTLISGPFIVSILLLVVAGFPLVIGFVGSALVGVAALFVLCATVPVGYRRDWPWTAAIGVVAALTWCGR